MILEKLENLCMLSFSNLNQQHTIQMSFQVQVWATNQRYEM